MPYEKSNVVIWLIFPVVKFLNNTHDMKEYNFVWLHAIFFVAMCQWDSVPYCLFIVLLYLCYGNVVWWPTAMAGVGLLGNDKEMCIIIMSCDYRGLTSMCVLYW